MHAHMRIRIAGGDDDDNDTQIALSASQPADKRAVAVPTSFVQRSAVSQCSQSASHSSAPV